MPKVGCSIPFTIPLKSSDGSYVQGATAPTEPPDNTGTNGTPETEGKTAILIQ